jgi:hypothetical protein
MNERLIKQWQVTEALLREAAAELPDAKDLAACENFLNHNEFELALDVLEDAGHGQQVSREFWWNLKKAAEVMGLRERYASLREQVRLATGAAQPVIPADASRRR